MAEAYGSLARPVQQDPFQQIINVHWNTLTHIAFKVNVHSNVTVVNPGVEYSGEFYESITALEDAIDYLGTSELVYSSQPASTFEGWNGRAWGPVADPTISGFPDLSGSAASYGAWEYTGSDSSPLVADYPRAKWDDVGGAGTGIFIPDNDTAEFKQGSVSVHLEAQEITGEPRFEGIGLPYPGPPDIVFWAAPFSLATTPISPLSFAIDDFVAILDGKAFRAMAAASLSSVDPESPVLVSSTLWVLCARSPADDPTP